MPPAGSAGGRAAGGSEAAAAVHCDDLSGDVRRLDSEKPGRASDVLGRTRALERRLGDDLVLERGIKVALRPQHRAGCDGVHANLGPEFVKVAEDSAGAQGHA